MACSEAPCAAPLSLYWFTLQALKFSWVALASQVASA